MKRCTVYQVMVPIDDGGLISGFSLFATTIEEARVLRDLAVDEGLRPVIQKASDPDGVLAEEIGAYHARKINKTPACFNADWTDLAEKDHVAGTRSVQSRLRRGRSTRARTAGRPNQRLSERSTK